MSASEMDGLGVNGGVFSSARRDERGNIVVIGSVLPELGIDVSYWLSGDGFASADWMPLSTSQDFSHFGVWVNRRLRQTFSFVEGDTYLTVCDSDELSFAECAYFAEFHRCKLPPSCVGPFPAISVAEDDAPMIQAGPSCWIYDRERARARKVDKPGSE